MNIKGIRKMKNNYHMELGSKSTGVKTRRSLFFIITN